MTVTVRIYTVASDTDYGTRADVFASQQEAEAYCLKRFENYWSDEYPPLENFTYEEASDYLCEHSGWIDTYSIDWHDVPLKSMEMGVSQ